MKTPLFYLLIPATLLLGLPLCREPWFDEVLTLTNFAALDSAAAIYHRYTIPNNHIIYSVCLHGWWNLFPDASDAFLRLLSLFAALSTICALWFGFRREIGEMPLTLTLAAWIVSPAFALYGTAIRGYMLCTFFVVLTLLGGKAYLAGKKYGAAVWFLFSLLAVGTMPSALAAIGGAGILLLPPLKQWKVQWHKLALLAVLPFVAFALFYLPIWKQLLHCAALGEGSSSAVGAFSALVIGIFSAFGMLMMTTDRRRKWLSWSSLRWLVWLIPVIAIFVLPKAPFPRIFIPFFPLFTLLIAETLKRQRRHSRKTLIALLIAVTTWGGVQRIPTVSGFLSSLCDRAGQDDFIAPRFMRKKFVPSQSAAAIAGNLSVYVTFDADPWALLWALGRQDAVPAQYLFDGPGRRMRELPPDAVVVTTHGEKAAVEKRFGVRLAPTTETPLHQIWRVLP